MKHLVFLILFMLILLFFNEIEAQQRGNRNKQNRNRQRVRVKPKFTVKKKQTTTEENKQQILCLVCSVEFLAADFDPNHICYNPGLNANSTRFSLISSCPFDARYCVTEITRVHGVFMGLQRRCGGAFCVEACFHKGFGIERESCTYCCDAVKPHHFAIDTENATDMPMMDDSNLISSSDKTTLNFTSLLEAQLANVTLTYRQQKELLLKDQAKKMESAYNCPPTYKNEY